MPKIKTSHSTTITVNTPKLEKQMDIKVNPGNNVRFGFDTSSAIFGREGNSLVITSQDGGVVRLVDYFVVGEDAAGSANNLEALPNFELADGTVISGPDFLLALSDNLDITPAAGPEASPKNNGIGQYQDDPGVLLGGVDRLGAIDYASGEREVYGQEMPSHTAALQGSLPGNDFSGTAAAPPSAATPPSAFPAGPFVRAVLYSPGSTGDAVTTSVFFGGNGTAPAAIASGDIDFDGTNAAAPYAVSVSLPAGWSSSWVDVSFNSLSGRLEFRLTADGVAEMQRLGLTGESLVDFIHITVTDRASGDSFEYNVELVATDNQNFDSAAHDSRYGGQHLDNIGEFHQGQNNGGAYSVVSSSQNDEIIINDTVIGGSSIHASGSADPAHMADDYNTINLAAGVDNTTLGSTTRITSADGRLDVSGGVHASGAGVGNGNVENIIDMGKGTVHIQNTDPYATGVGAWLGGKNTISGGEVDIHADNHGIFAYGSGVNTVSVTDGDLNVTAAQGDGIGAIHGSTNIITVENGSVYIDAEIGMASAYKDVVQGVFTGPDSKNSIVTKGGSVTINAGYTGISADVDSSNAVSTNGGDITISSTGAYAGAVHASAGSNTIDAGADGNVTITNTSSSTGSQETGTGVAADNSGSNKIISGSGNVTISGSITGPGSLSQTSPIMGHGMAASSDGSNKVETTDGNVTVSGSYTGANNPSGATRWGAGYGMYATTDGSNDIITTSGDVKVTGSRDGLGAGRGSGMVAVGGSNSITTKDGNVATSGTGSNAGTGYGMSATSSGSNSIVTESGSVSASGNIGMLASGSLSGNSVTTKGGNVDVAGSGIANAYGSGMDAGSSGSNTITTESGNVTVTSNGAAGSSGMSVSSSASNEIKTANGAVTVTAKSDTGASSTGMSAGNYGSNSITTDSGKVAVTGESRDGSGTGMSSSNYGSNSITTTTKTGDVTVTGSGENGDGYGMFAKNKGSNTIETVGGNVTVTGNGNGTGSYSDGYGMHAESAGSSNKIETVGGNVTVTGNGNGTGSHSDGYGMFAKNKGSNTIETVGGNVTVTGNGNGNGSYSDGYGMFAEYAGSNNEIKTADGNVTVTGNGNGTGSYSDGYGMSAKRDGSNTIETVTGNVTVTGNGNGTGSYSDGYGMFAEYAGSNNEIKTAAGNVTVTGNGNGTGSYSHGYGMSAKRDGSNTIETVTGNVTVTGNGNGNGTYRDGYGMFAEYAGSNNEIKTAAGNVTVTGNGNGTGSYSHGYGMSAKRDGSNTIETVTGNVTVTGNGNGNGTYRDGYGMSAKRDGSNTIETVTGNVTVTGNGNGNGTYRDGYGMSAEYAGSNNEIKTAAGNVTVTGNGNGNGSYSDGYGMSAERDGSNTIETVTGNVTVTGNGNGTGSYSDGYGMFAEYTGSNNEIKTAVGNVTVTGNSNGNGNYSHGYGMSAKSDGSNTIETVTGNVTVTGNGNGSYSHGYGMFAEYAGSNNEIKTADGNVTVSGTGTTSGSGMFAQGTNSSNSITTDSGDVTVTGNGASSSYGMYAKDSGSNSIKTESGNVTVTSTGVGNLDAAVYAFGTGSKNTVAGGSAGEVEITGAMYGLHASSGGENKVTGSDIAITSDNGTNVSSNNVAAFATGWYGKNTIGDNSTDTVAIKGTAYGLRAESNAKNIVTGKDVTVEGGSIGMQAFTAGTNTINSDNATIKGGMYAQGDVLSKNEIKANGTVEIDGNNAVWTKGQGQNEVTGNDIKIDGKAKGLFADGSGVNSITAKNGGDVSINARDGLAADGSGRNTITAQGGSIEVKGNKSGTGASASNGGSNTITATGSGTVDIIDNSAGLVAASGGSNTISAADGKISVDATNTGLKAEGAGSGNTITGKDINITAQTSSSNGLLAEAGGKNSVTGTGGNVALFGGKVLRATGTGSENTLSVDAGSIEFNSWSAKVNWSPTNSLLYYDDCAAHATDGGSNAILGTGGTNISFTGQGFGLRADSGGGNYVKTDGDVAFSGITTALSAIGIQNTIASTNTLIADNIVIDSKVYADRTVAAVNALAGGQNTLTAAPGGAITIATSAATDSKRDPYSTDINDTASVRADGAGSHNVLTADKISLDNQCGKGLFVTNGGVNTLESTSGSPLTVTITASADSAEKAIAMWADGGGSVNYITGHSQAGDTDSITLTANNGQGIAMQATNGGKNIITTGAGDDHVIINGKILDDGNNGNSGNEINLGGGGNSLTINGAVQAGSLNVIAAGGTYTLILQESDTESFAVRYGAWLNGIGASGLITSGLSGISFEGWDDSALSAAYLADFMSTFGGFLNTLYGAGVPIEPQELFDYLTNPSPTPTTAALLAETGADIPVPDSHHASHDGTDSGMADDMQNSQALTHHTVSHDNLEAIFDTQPDSLWNAQPDLEPDAIPQTHVAENDGGEDATPLFFTSLSSHFASVADTAFEEGDNTLHNGYLSSEGDDGGDYAEIHAPITLTYGDESIDSLFAATDQQDVEKDGADLWYGGFDPDLHDMGLTDMNEGLGQGRPAEPAVNYSALPEGDAAIVDEGNCIPSVLNSCQETTDNAVREMVNC